MGVCDYRLGYCIISELSKLKETTSAKKPAWLLPPKLLILNKTLDYFLHQTCQHIIIMTTSADLRAEGVLQLLSSWTHTAISRFSISRWWFHFFHLLPLCDHGNHRKHAYWTLSYLSCTPHHHQQWINGEEQPWSNISFKVWLSTLCKLQTWGVIVKLVIVWMLIWPAH